ncbi:MAG: DMT family transporter [Desulfohalobiaceae bacterium]|nr:DMT family transporter [Desulfohalobiaceae bacterium]
MKLLLVTLMVVLAGALAPTQAGINARLSTFLHSNILTALVSFFVGTLGLLAYSLLLRLKWPPLTGLSQVPWWMWLGGLCGAYLVTVTIIAAPKLGATTMFAFFLAGQMAASLLLDHFGLLGFPVHTLSLWRVFGVFLVACGALLIKYF